MEKNSHTSTTLEAHHGTMKSYIIGFTLSILLTLFAYFVVSEHLLTGWFLIGSITLLCITQVTLQLIFFLHLGDEAKPRWNLISFFFMLGVIVILVIGSLWIIENLNERMMPEMKDLDKNHGLRP